MTNPQYLIFYSSGNACIDVPFLFPAIQKWTVFPISKRKEKFNSYEKDVKTIRHSTGFFVFATTVTTLLTTTVHASETQYWTESAEWAGYIEKIMNDGSIDSTFNEGIMKVEGETACCVDINTNFKNGY